MVFKEYMISCPHNIALAQWIVVAIDIEFVVVQTKHAQDCSCMRITTVQMLNVT